MIVFENVVASLCGTNLIVFGALSAAGVLPRVGLLSALRLGWKSYFKSVSPVSARKNEVEKLNELLRRIHKGNYISIIGERGMGKTCLINTALRRQHGVINISVS